MSWTQGNQKLYKKFQNINQEILSKEGYIEEGEAKLLLYKFLRENPSFTSELFTGVKLFPFQHMAINATAMLDPHACLRWCHEHGTRLDENYIKRYIQVSHMHVLISNFEMQPRRKGFGEKCLYVKTCPYFKF